MITMMMVMMMMMMVMVAVLAKKVPLFSKVNQNSGSRTFSALLMVMMMIPRIMTMLVMNNGDDAIFNQMCRS